MGASREKYREILEKHLEKSKEKRKAGRSRSGDGESGGTAFREDVKETS
ncbi:MAG: hypothetical protein ABEJ03_06320 [Candidatus Nanohaloarchaea archaeon]